MARTVPHPIFPAEMNLMIKNLQVSFKDEAGRKFNLQERAIISESYNFLNLNFI